MEKEREVERRGEPPAQRDDVRVAGNRCPYCHEYVARESASVCRDCLARHHAACWTEAPRCGACGSPHALQPSLSALTPETLREALGEALRREGLPNAGRCAAPHCFERGVTPGNATARRYCRAHAASARSDMTTNGGILLLLGLSVVALSVLLAVGREVPTALALCAPGALMILAGVSARWIARTLPPIPPPDERA